MWELDHKESWVPKNRCFQIVVLEKALESSLDSKEVKPVNPKGSQLWILLVGLTLKLKPQYFGHLMQRANSLGKTLMLEKIESRMTRGWQRVKKLTNKKAMGRFPIERIFPVTLSIGENWNTALPFLGMNTCLWKGALIIELFNFMSGLKLT